MDIHPTLHRKPAVLKRYALSSTKLWRMCKAGTFPPPMKLGGKIVAWREADLVAWEQSLAPAPAYSKPRAA